MINRTHGTLSVGMVFLILVTVGMLSAGQVLFKYASHGLDLSRPNTFLSLPLIVAMLIYGVATIFWLIVLSRIPLSVAFPFYGLTFLLVPLLSWMVLGEKLGLATLVGSAIIAFGVVVVAVGDRI